MSADEFPDPPDVAGLNPQLMTAAELQSQLESLFDWLQRVEALPANSSAARPDEESVERIRDAANLLLSERRERHSDENAPRGGQA